VNPVDVGRYEVPAVRDDSRAGLPSTQRTHRAHRGEGQALLSQKYGARGPRDEVRARTRVARQLRVNLVCYEMHGVPAF
jgi:hypothetical protein